MSDQLPVRVVDWNRVKSTVGLALFFLAVISGSAAFYFWNFPSVLATEGVILCLALGFWITERLVAVFTQTRRANPTAIVLLLFGKLVWWGALFAGARMIPPGYDRPVGLGIGAFLLALLVGVVKHYGMPRITDGKPPVDP